MNRRDKKRLYKKYLQKIESALQRDCENPERIEEIEEVKLYAEVAGFKLFYTLYQKYLWPNLKDNRGGSSNIWTDRTMKLKDDTTLNREVVLKQLGI